MRSSGRPDGKLIGQLSLGALGLLMATAGAWGFLAGPNNKIAGGVFVILGALAVLAAAFYPRVDHWVELGLLKVPHAIAHRAESQLGEGRVVAAADLEDTLTALRQTLALHHVPAGAADVMLADDAVFSAAALGPRDQAVLIGELARMASVEFRVDLDLREIPRGSATRTYRMHRLPDSDVRVWYRQKSEFEPHVLCVTVIEKTDRDN